MKWAVKTIANWIPQSACTNLYHIHGTKDQIFPYEQLHDVYPVEDGDHLMVFKKADMVSGIFAKILSS